jgi:deoxyinosine 3'endonuclease (endonuclease V)
MKLDFTGVTPAEAAAVQERLAREVVRFDDLGAVRTICGVDVHYAEGGVACAAAVVLAYPGLEPIRAAHRLAREGRQTGSRAAERNR